MLIRKRIHYNSIKKGQRFVLFIGIPSLIGLMFCAEDLISTIFYRGAFTEVDVLNLHIA
jgi:peptidoglycan biosynthesis protein MviN/MurJ (putative lipid II flippase)